MGLDIRGWLEKGTGRLYSYRPRFRDWHFWAVQGLIVAIAGTHSTAELLKMLGHAPYLGSEPRVALASFVTVSLLFVPVVYAALNFGFAGSVATALWCTFLTLPNVIVLHAGMEQVREVLQIGVVDAIAVFVGQRVDREVQARKRAETASLALRVSETKYRGLFESSPVAVLVLSPAGMVLEANPAASALFGKLPDLLKRASMADLVGTEAAVRLLDATQNNRRREDYIALKANSGSEVYVEPALTRISDDHGEPAIQVLLRDVTEERHRQAGLKVYAAQMLRAQEEERKRIAQELHDEIVQALVLLCRRLDGVETASGALSPSTIERLREARGSAEGIVQELRNFSRALRPPILEDLGLVTSVRRLLVDLAERSKIDGQLKLTGEERRLPLDTELGLFRIAQEALRNVERHAQASRVVVTLAFTKHRVRLNVSDNGVGFTPSRDPNDLAIRGKLGLLGMQERTELIAGSFEIRSAPGDGTSVTVSIPA